MAEVDSMVFLHLMCRLFSLLMAKVTIKIYTYDYLIFLSPGFQVWSVLTSGRYHGAVPRRIKAFVCHSGKLL